MLTKLLNALFDHKSRPAAAPNETASKEQHPSNDRHDRCATCAELIESAGDGAPTDPPC